jgi:Tol biopolymer transport system component
VAGVTRAGATSTVWVLDADGSNAVTRATGARLSFPAWSSDGRIACLSLDDERQHLRFPCADATPLFTDQEAYGPIAFSLDGSRLYYASPGDEGFLDVWARTATGTAPERLSAFERDAYAPSVGADGRIVFKSQEYRTTLATAPAPRGPSTPLTTFQSETPSWSWDGREIAFTFGSWRHVTDDFHYPDIAQHIGVVATDSGPPKRAPDRVVRSSESEDQAMHWSPNGRWIAFHTHEGSDDIWLMPADGGAAPRMISEGGSETGWARWSSDGRWIVFPSYREGTGGGRRAHLFVIGVDQAIGEVTSPQARVEMPGFEFDIIHGEWADRGDEIVFEAAEEIGRKSLWRVPRSGGTPTRVHDFASDQVSSGISVAPDGRWVAFVDRDREGYFQIFRVSDQGGVAEQVTRDPSHKTQPAYSPRGDRIAFTVFDYRVHFWSIEP